MNRRPLVAILPVAVGMVLGCSGQTGKDTASAEERAITRQEVRIVPTATPIRLAGTSFIMEMMHQFQGVRIVVAGDSSVAFAIFGRPGEDLRVVRFSEAIAAQMKEEFAAARDAILLGDAPDAKSVYDFPFFRYAGADSSGRMVERKTLLIGRPMAIAESFLRRLVESPSEALGSISTDELVRMLSSGTGGATPTELVGALKERFRG